ncbi:MAG: hypothetical protein AAGF85_02355 [Bacteroidota bacterium]
MGFVEKVIMLVENNKRVVQLSAGIIIALIIALTETQAQNTEGFIYGKVYTRDNTYQGQLRWGKEEAFWNDHFNASKVSNRNRQYRPRKRDENDNSWSNFDWSFSSIWENKSTTSHQFVTQFGDIAGIENVSESRAIIMLKNGEEVEVSSQGYNDLSPSIRILDDELGELTIKWSRVRRVQFLPTPAKLRPVLGQALYGTVNVYRKGDLNGYIQWDHDERISTDKLDGDTRDGDIAISFGKIRKIESGRGGSDVELLDGRTFYLTGSNDVNSGNRGIIVTVDGVGKVNIPWKVFNSVTFDPVVKSSGKSYASYGSPKPLIGTVYTYNDDKISGRIVFDIDEAMDIEFLEGKDDELEYRIPFRNIKSIKPKNYNYSQLKLRNGDTLLLGDMRDVTDNNDGLLVFQKGSREPEYISWKKIDEIVFD